MAPVDIKSRYSLYVPKPLARINLGDWQRRDLQSPRFGYAGVSIQTDSNLFVDVTRGTHIQAKGGYVVQTTDWLTTSRNAMYIATSDSATVGADGTIVMAAGAGHGPTFTLDHGDSMDTFPYNPLSLHYRVEEVQNSLFEFFRGRRKKSPQEKTTQGWTSWWFKRDPFIFNSSKTGFLKNPFDSMGSNPMGYDGAKEDAQVDGLKGGFERVANVSWHRLFGSDDTWDTAAPPQPPALPEVPQDLFAGLGDIRKDPKLKTKADIEGSDGDETEEQLVYGFSAYFSRFDPYALIDPDRFAGDVKKKKLGPLDSSVLTILARVHNALVKMKRTVDVVYKIGGVLKDNSLFKLLQDGAAAVDGFNGAMKAFRGQYEQLIENPYITRKSGHFYDQMADEEASGHGGRAKRLDALDSSSRSWAARSTSKATVRSGSPGKDFGVFGDKSTLADGDVLTITADAGTVFTTPPLSLAAQPGAPAKAASIQGGAPTTSAWTIASGTVVRVAFDNGAATDVPLTAQTIESLADAQARDDNLVANGQAAHFVADRTAAMTALQQAIVNVIGARCTLANGTLKLTSANTGTDSSVFLQDSHAGTLANLGLTTTIAVGSGSTPPKPAKLAKEVKPEDVLALLKAATQTPPSTPPKSVATYFSFSLEGEQVVITREKEGNGSEVTVGGSMAPKLQFVGDARGWSGRDKIEDSDDFRRGQDDFEKAMLDVQQLPQDTANLARPMIFAWRNAANAVNKLNGAVKSLFKIGGLKLPSNKGAIGLIANSGISLGTPDRIVGAGGQGIVFIADGGTGKPDHAKYAMLEDIVNRFTAADFVGALRELILGTDPPKINPSLGFRVYSDTTVDLVGRTTANLIALGRADDAQGGTVGTGIARVAASYGAEVAAQKKVVVRAREKDAGRVELLGSTIALGYSDMDAAETTFGLDDQPGDGPKGWSANLKAQHPKTASVLVHSTDQAVITVGKYMVQLRSATKSDTTLAQAQADKQNAEARLAQFKKEQADLKAEKLKKQLIIPLPDGSNRQEHAAAQARVVEIDTRLVIVDQAVKDETKNVRKFTAAVQSASKTNDEGVIISMRDPADQENTSGSNWAWKAKPAIVLSEKGVTITTTAGKDTEATTARITLDDKGVTIHVGDKKAGVVIKKDTIELSNGVKKAVLGNSGKFHSDASHIDFGEAQKVTLG